MQMCGYSTSAGGPGLWKVTLDNLSGTFGPVNQTATSTFFCCNGTLYAHTITRVFSEQAWSFPNATLPPGQPVPKMDARYAPQISEASGSLVSLGAENDVFALSLKRGTQRWRFPFANTAALLQPVICETLGLVVLVDVQANGGKGEVLGVDLKTGALAWRQPMGGESGALADPLIEGTVLYLSGKRFQGFSLESFGKEGQQVDRIADIALEELGGSGDGLVVVNGAVIFPTSANTVICHRFSEERAAWFDGAQSCITLKPEDHSFLPGTGDFTLEAWVRTSSGGEVICVQPEDALTYGARLNISANGELQFAVINQQGGGSIYWSKSTPATDGRYMIESCSYSQGNGLVNIVCSFFCLFITSVLRLFRSRRRDSSNSIAT